MSENKHITVGEVMSVGVRTIGGMATVREAINVMRETGVSSLVVERRDDKDEYGLVEVYDIAKQVIAENRSPDRVNVYEIMSKPVLSVPDEMHIRYAVRLLVQFRLSRALVVDHDRTPRGIVTMRDMVVHEIGESE